jgi:hypothetical protein
MRPAPLLVLCLFCACGGSSSGLQDGGSIDSGTIADTGATADAAPSALSTTWLFSPNSTTISTSEGAPYGDCDFWTTKSSGCTSESNLGYGPTKVIRLYVCLSGEVSLSSCSQQPAVSGPLTQAMLGDIATRIAAFAGSGVRLMVRFTYNFGPIGPGAMDAPIGVISSHIDQLAPILLQNRDLVFALEAGFIGTWGEWHDSTNGNDNAAAQKTVLDKELSYFSGVFPVLVRCPGQLIQYTGSLTPRPGLGLHDDYYASNTTDAATWSECAQGAGFCLTGYTASQLQAYAAAVSATTMFAGEFGALDATLQSCGPLASYSYTYGLQSLSLFPYPTAIATELQGEGCALAFYNRVGTRIEVEKVTLDGSPTANGQLSVGITLVNTGFGRVIRARPASLVFLANGQVLGRSPIPLSDMDLRQLAASPSPAAQTFSLSATLPAALLPSQSVSVALLIPDPAPSLSSQPAYALPLNSVDANSRAVFDPATGYNLLGSFESW